MVTVTREIYVSVKPGPADKYSEGEFYEMLVHKGLVILNKKTSLDVREYHTNSNSVSYNLGSVHYIGLSGPYSVVWRWRDAWFGVPQYHTGRVRSGPHHCPIQVMAKI